MSRTWKDKPDPTYPMPDWDAAREEWDRWINEYPPCRGYRGGRIWRHVRIWWGKERARVRDQLRKGEEPEPSRTRSSVKWDMW